MADLFNLDWVSKITFGKGVVGKMSSVTMCGLGVCLGFGLLVVAAGGEASVLCMLFGATLGAFIVALVLMFIYGCLHPREASLEDAHLVRAYEVTVGAKSLSNNGQAAEALDIARPVPPLIPPSLEEPEEIAEFQQ